MLWSEFSFLVNVTSTNPQKPILSKRTRHTRPRSADSAPPDCKRRTEPHFFWFCCPVSFSAFYSLLWTTTTKKRDTIVSFSVRLIGATMNKAKPEIGTRTVCQSASICISRSNKQAIEASGQCQHMWTRTQIIAAYFSFIKWPCSLHTREHFYFFWRCCCGSR